MLPRVAGIARGRTGRRRRTRQGGHSDQHVRRQRRRSRQPALTLALPGLHQDPLEELAHDPEREPLLELRRPRLEDQKAESGRLRACLLEQPRLADPWGAVDDQGSTVAISRGMENGANALDLVLALEQRVRPGNRGPVHAPADRKRRGERRAMFGGRCQGCARCAGR